MTLKRDQNFYDQVAKAARRLPRRTRQGRPAVANLSEEGRAMGLASMRSAPRCSASKRDGEPCKNPRVNGGTKCRMHGGLRQVPEHPSNLRAFADGSLYDRLERRRKVLHGKALWDDMTWKEKRETQAAVPRWCFDHPQAFYFAIIAMEEANRFGRPSIWHDFLKEAKSEFARV